MAVSKYVEWLFTSMIFHYSCSEYNIDREVCLDKPFAFALSYDGCWFTLNKAREWLESGTSICSQKCHVKLNNLKAAEWNYGDYGPTYQLKSLALSFNGLSETLTTINTRCSNSNKEKTLEINVDISKDLCTSTKVCEEESKTCSTSLAGQIGICVCKPDYIGFGDECLKGNLKLNETCKRNEQCSVAFGSVCQNDTCVCSRGYVPLNDSECVLWQAGGNSQASIQDQKEDNVVGVTVGSVVGGFILGIILTAFAVTIYHQVRHGKPKTKERECSNVAFFNNTTCETEKDAHQNIPSVHRTHERKVLNVPPFAHSVELPMNRNAQEATKSSMTSNDVRDGVYNHLHEKKEDADIDDNYDHIHGNPSHAMGESDYSNLNTGRQK